MLLERMFRSTFRIFVMLALFTAAGRSLWAQVELIGEREHALLLDASVVNRSEWRGYDRGAGLTIVPRVALPYWFSKNQEPERAVLFDVDGSFKLTDIRSNVIEDQLALRAQALFQLPGNDPWEFRMGYAHYMYPDAHESSSRWMGEAFVSAIAPQILDRKNFPIHPYVWVGWDTHRYNGVYSSLGILQSKQLEQLYLELDVSASASNYREAPLGERRSFGFHEFSTRVFLGRTHLNLSGSWKDYGLVLGLDVARHDVGPAIRGVIGVRVGVAGVPPGGT